MKRRLTYEERVQWFVANYYESGMEYKMMLHSLKDKDLNAIEWHGDVVSIPEYEEVNKKI